MNLLSISFTLWNLPGFSRSIKKLLMKLIINKNISKNPINFLRTSSHRKQYNYNL